MKSSNTRLNDFTYAKSATGGKKLSMIANNYSGTNTSTASGGITPIVHTGESKFNNASVMLVSPDGVKPYGNCNVGLSFGLIENSKFRHNVDHGQLNIAKKDDDTTPTSSSQLVSFNTTGGDNALLTRMTTQNKSGYIDFFGNDKDNNFSTVVANGTAMSAAMVGIMFVSPTLDLELFYM